MREERSCTSLDHIWKSPKWGSLKKGDPCYCGAREWGVEWKPGKKKQKERDANSGKVDSSAVERSDASPESGDDALF